MMNFNLSTPQKTNPFKIVLSTHHHIPKIKCKLSVYSSQLLLSTGGEIICERKSEEGTRNKISCTPSLSTWGLSSHGGRFVFQLLFIMFLHFMLLGKLNYCTLVCHNCILSN